jgi:hypothetical protein
MLDNKPIPDWCPSHLVLRVFARVRFVLCLAGLLLPLAWPVLSAEPITFSVMGDAPYADEIAEVQAHLDDHNLYSPSEFMVHVGDIKSGEEPCDESRYQLMAEMLRSLAVPSFILPGDNETTDCPD